MSEKIQHAKRLKVVFLGDRSVGKSSIIQRYMSNRFNETISATIGVDFMTKKTIHRGCNFKMDLWDTAGQQKYRSLVRGYLKNADVCLFIYDCTSYSSYKSLNQWLEIYKSISNSYTYKLIIGNKCDLIDQMGEVTNAMKQQLKQNNEQLSNIKEILVSAKTGQNIDDIFEQILENCTMTKIIDNIGSLKSIRIMPKVQSKCCLR